MYYGIEVPWINRRDAVDLYLSMRYPLVMFINDMPCGLARHMECICPNISSELWGNRTGCFEKPTIGVDPIQVQLYCTKPRSHV